MRDLVHAVAWPVENGMFAGRMEASRFHAQRPEDRKTVCGRPIGWELFRRDVTQLIWRTMSWRAGYVAFPGVMTLQEFQDLRCWKPAWRHKQCQQCAKARTR